jgi:colanic acid/amylovoran biosynthesis glycosyltransferase
MRIGYITNHYPRATDTFIQREVAALRKRGLEIRTFSVRRSGSEHEVSPEVIAEKRATHYLLPVALTRLIYANAWALVRAPHRYLGVLALAVRTRRPGLRGLALQLAYFQEAVILSLQLKRQGITHVHDHGGDNSGTVTLLAGALMRVGYSITIHGPYIFFDPTHWALRQKLRDSRFIACISHYCRSQVMLFSDQADWDRLKIVRCGIDVERFRYAEVRQQARQLLYVGRLALEKGLPVLFQSLRILVTRGYDFELTLAGDGHDRRALEELARQLGIYAHLNFAGYIDQERVREYLRQSDIFILPSFAEGVPVSLMEAMDCGVPVLSTYVGGIAELVESERTGLLVPAGDSAALSESIARYFDDFELRQRVSRLARQKIVAGFNLDKEADKLAELFAAHASG